MSPDILIIQTTNGGIISQWVKLAKKVADVITTIGTNKIPQILVNNNSTKNHHPRESKISSFVQEKTSGRVFWGKSPLCNPNRERAGPNNGYMFP